MNAILSRRAFLAGGSAAFLAAGCKSAGGWFGASPDLRFGVVSDIHVTTPESCALFERSLRYFKGRGVDAVMVPGDLTDWGLRASLVYVKKTWDRVFAGTSVVPLMCTGNHDYEGWCYGDMTMEMHANGYSERDRLVRLEGGLAAGWAEVFGEKFAPVRVRTVKGYDFISAEWQGFKDFPAWMAANGSRFKGTKPFFYFQHPPAKGTTSDSFGWADDGCCHRALAGYPNAVVFTGHAHRPFYDERSIWQGAFTAIATPSLSYAGMPGGYENGDANRGGKARNAMPTVPYRRDLRGGQGYVVSVYPQEMVVERVDLEALDSDAPAWVVPLPVAGAKPYDPQVRGKRSVAPEFPADAELRLSTRNTENRQGRWVIVLDCEFPSAAMPDGGRVYDYEIRAVPTDGSDALVKRFLSPAFARMAKDEPARQRFWFDVAELPQDKPYVIEVRARNCFGRASAALVSRIRRGLPGLATVDRS